MERTQQRLNKETSALSVNTDSFLKVNLENSQRLLPTNEIIEIVNVAERFNIERQRCKYYRIISTFNTTMTNALFNLRNSAMSDKYTWSWFNSLDFLDTSYPKDNDVIDDTDLTYPASLKANLKEKDGWFGCFDPDITKAALCNYFDMEPKRERFSLIPDINPFMGNVNTQPVKNWEITITYPKEIDKTHNFVNNGLLITDAVLATVATRPMTAIGMSCMHNLTIGDIVRITGTTGYDGDHVVVRTGLDNGDFKEYYFVIDKPNTGVLGSNSRMKKLINGNESEYYFRKFRKIKTRTTPIIETDDYEVYKAGFSENFFNDSIIQVIFNEDIDVTDLTDNLGRPLSELYLTIIKTSSNNLFTNVSSGIETPFSARLNNSNNISYLRNIPTIHKIHNGVNLPFPSHTPLENDVKINNNNNIPNNNDYYGDIVEYNINTLNEVVLANVQHRFNTVDRQTSHSLSYVSGRGTPLNPNVTTTTITLGPRQEGYYYQPHHKLKIREFSSYIEQGDEFTEGIPSYAVNLGDGRIIWRDLLDIGFNESEAKPLDYPFLNNSHYLYQNNCFTLRRQDPFGVWGLYYGKFPEDPVGDRITDKFKINSEEDVC